MSVKKALKLERQEVYAVNDTNGNVDFSDDISWLSIDELRALLDFATEASGETAEQEVLNKHFISVADFFFPNWLCIRANSNGVVEAHKREPEIYNSLWISGETFTIGHFPPSAVDRQTWKIERTQE